MLSRSLTIVTSSAILFFVVAMSVGAILPDSLAAELRATAFSGSWEAFLDRLERDYSRREDVDALAMTILVLRFVILACALACLWLLLRRLPNRIFDQWRPNKLEPRWCTLIVLCFWAIAAMILSRAGAFDPTDEGRRITGWSLGGVRFAYSALAIGAYLLVMSVIVAPVEALRHFPGSQNYGRSDK